MLVLWKFKTQRHRIELSPKQAHLHVYLHPKIKGHYGKRILKYYLQCFNLEYELNIWGNPLKGHFGGFPPKHGPEANCDRTPSQGSHLPLLEQLSLFFLYLLSRTTVLSFHGILIRIPTSCTTLCRGFLNDIWF